MSTLEIRGLKVSVDTENGAVELGGRFGGLRGYFQIADFAVGHAVSGPGGRPSYPV